MSWRKVCVYIVVLTTLCCVFPHTTFAAVNWNQCVVQSGESTILANNSSATVTLSNPVTDLTKSFVLINTTSGNTGSAANAHMATGYLSDTSTLTVERGVGSSAAANFTYQVINCPNNEFTVQTGTITINASTTTNTGTISSVDTSTSMVIVSAYTTDTTANQTSALVYGYLSDATTVTVARSVTPIYPAVVRYQVVTFSGESGVTVQTNNINFTGNVASVTSTISAVTLDRTWLYCSWSSVNNTLRATAVGCELTNTTTVTAYRYAATDYTNLVQYYVVQFPSGKNSVQRGVVANNSPTTNDGARYDYDITIAAVNQTSKAFGLIYNTTSGTATLYPRNTWIYRLNSTTALRTTFFRGDGTGTADLNNKYWQVIEFTGINTPTIQSTTSSSRNPTITSSTFNGNPAHTATSWKVATSNNCTSGTSVWESLNNASALTSVVVNTTNGTFMNDLAGQTALALDTAYYTCVQYHASAVNSEWSTPYYFSTNVAPTTSSALIHSGAPSIILNAGITTAVTGTVSVTDSDGCQDIVSVSATLYRTSLGSSGSPNNAYRYTATCTQDVGTCSGGGDDTAQYTCPYALQYYADPTDVTSPQPSDDWTFLVTPSDEIGTGSTASDTMEVNALAALSVTSSISFGELALGANTGSTNQIIAVTNTGNVRLDVQVAAYGATPGDNLAMSCTSGSVAASLMKYFTAMFTYASSGIVFSSSDTEVDIDIMQVGSGTSTKNIYTGLQLPSTSVSGSCAGYISVNAVYDAAAD